MTFHEDLKQKYPEAIKTRCDKDGCTLRLDDLADHQFTVLDADEYRNYSGCEGKLCDLFIFLSAGKMIAVAAEMKSGRLNARHAAEQIRNGAKQLEAILGAESNIQFVALLVGSPQHPTELTVLRSQKVRFRGIPHPILIHSCGSQLKQVLKAGKLIP